MSSYCRNKKEKASRVDDRMPFHTELWFFSAIRVVVDIVLSTWQIKKWGWEKLKQIASGHTTKPGDSYSTPSAFPSVYAQNCQQHLARQHSGLEALGQPLSLGPSLGYEGGVTDWVQWRLSIHFLWLPAYQAWLSLCPCALKHLCSLLKAADLCWDRTGSRYLKVHLQRGHRVLMI